MRRLRVLPLMSWLVIASSLARAADESLPDTPYAHLDAAVSDGEVEPEVQAIITTLRNVEEQLVSLSVDYRCKSRFNFYPPGAKPDDETFIEDNAVSSRRTVDVQWEIHADGRGRLESRGRTTNIRFDGSRVERNAAILSVFDGQHGRLLESILSEQGAVLELRGWEGSSLRRMHMLPFDMLTHYLNKPIGQLLEDGRAQLIERKQWEQRPVSVLQVAPIKVREDHIYRQHFWVDVERAVVVRCQSFGQRGLGKPWGLHLQQDAKKFSQDAASKLWLPSVFDAWNYSATPQGQGHLVAQDHFEISRWRVNPDFAPERFQLEFPANTQR